MKKTKRILSVLLTLLILFGTVSATVITASAEKYGVLDYEINDGEVTITGCDKEATGAVTIPSKINGYFVTIIGDYSFSECTALTSITIPDSVESIGESAFSGCSSLKSIDLPDGLTTIVESAFSGCSSLTSLAIGSKTTSIGYKAFTGCDSLTSITVSPENPVYDSRNNCNAIIKTSTNELVLGCKTTVIPNSIIKIGDFSFAGNSELTRINIPDSVTSFGYGAFAGCVSLTSISIPDSVESIGECAFSECTNLSSITIPDSVTSIGYDAFSYTALKRVVLPNGLKTISYGLFYSCESLESVTIPNSVKSIGEEAFSGCTSLTNITIPDSVEIIGSGVFDNTAYYSNSNNWENGVLYIGNHLIKAKDTVSGSYTIKSGTKAISDKAFSECTDLTNVTIPNSVKSIGEEAFSGCTDLISIAIPNGVTSIGDYTFSNCSNLKNVTIGNKVTSIGRGAFGNCSSLTNISLPDSVTIIDDEAFYGCSSLSSITIPDGIMRIGREAFGDTAYYNNNGNWENGVLYIGNHLIKAKDTVSGNYTVKNGTKTIADYAFSDCTSLTSVTIPNSVKSIGEEAFSGCTGLTNVTIPDSVTSIGVGAFRYCSNLTSIAIPNTVTSISGSMFGYCYGLTSVTIPDSVTSIGIGAFEYCSGLTSITIPDSVTSIGNSAFFYCTSLTSVTIPNSVTSIGYGAFEHCSGLTSITIPYSVTDIDEYAFGYYMDDYSYDYEKLSDFKIYCYKNTAGEQYAIDNGFDYELLDAPVSTYTITYNANGGSGAPAAQTKTHDVALTLSSTVPTRNGYTFKGWATSANGSAQYQPGATYTANAAATLYAVWAPVTYTISYNANGGSGAPAAQTKTHDVALTLSSTVPTRNGYTFNGWATSANGSAQYQPGATYTANAAATLYAVWTPISYTVNFYDGTTLLGSKTLSFDESGTLSYGSVPTKDGFKFTGWSTFSGGVATLKNGQEIKNLSSTDGAVISYYAAWKAVETITVTDAETGVSVTASEGAYTGDLTLKVEKVLSGSSFDILETVDDVVEKSEVFSIETYVNGVLTQPGGYVTVKIPVPAGFDASKCELYYLNTSTKKAEPVSFTIEGKFIIFKTNHFSDWAIVQSARSVKGVSVGDVTLNYKQSTTLNPVVTADEGAKYTVKYESNNPKVATVDGNGNIYAAKKGTAEIKVIVTDENNNTFTDTCKVTVKYSGLQWFIIIVLFGWIWY